MTWIVCRPRRWNDAPICQKPSSRRCWRRSRSNAETSSGASSASISELIGCSSYVENHMNEAGIQILDLDDLAPLGKTKRVAALAFVRLYSNECEQTLTGGSFSTTA